MKNWQIISRLGLTLDFQKSVTASEALRKYAVSRQFVDYTSMCKYLNISNGYRVQKETSKIIVD